jgi:hypothetical protein
MTSKTILASGKTGLVSGLDWRVLLHFNDKKRRDAEIREAASDREASKICLVDTEGHASVGLYSPDDEQPKGVRQLHSLAAVVAHQVGTENVIVAWSFGSGQCAVTVIEAGVPVADVVQASAKARETVLSYLNGKHGFADYRVLTNNQADHPEGDLIESEQLFAGIGKASRLIAKPVNVKGLLLFLVLLVAAAGSSLAVHQYREQQRKIEMRRLAAANDPLPKYQDALMSQIGQMGIARASLATLYQRLTAMPVWVAGWELERVTCTQDGSCVATWVRRGGTTADLLAARRGESIHPDSQPEKVLLQWTEQLQMGGVTGPNSIVSDPAEQQRGMSVLQTWSNAGIVTNIGQVSTVWPTAPGVDPSALPAKEVVHATPVEVNAHGAVAAEAIVSAPPSVWWNAITIEVKNTDALTAVKTILKGNIYAR